MRVIVRQISGLGNQLFQYAAGIYYARHYGGQLSVVLEPAKQRFSNGAPRPVLLSHFNISAPVYDAGWTDNLYLTERRKLQPMARVARSLSRVHVLRETLAQRYALLSPPVLPDDLRALYLVGYWQTYRIAAAVEDQVRREFAFREPAAGRNAEVLARIAATSQPVSLHIRRGDYTLAVEGNLALPMTYYQDAIRAMREKLANPTFFVFSDDPGFARANLPHDLPAVYIDHNDDYTSFEDLRLMSGCHHHILANSSFSWWGAWLNTRRDKTVFAPRQWLRLPGSSYPELTPPEWRLFDVA
jgi:hypothetical protein